MSALQRTRMVDWSVSTPYAPMTRDAVIALDDISQVHELEPRSQRLSEPCVQITFRSGKSAVYMGRPEDFLP